LERLPRVPGFDCLGDPRIYFWLVSLPFRWNRRAGMDLIFHSLRHTAVSLLKDAGIPDAVVMAIVGHSSAAMSHRYTHVGKESLAKAAASLPEL